MLRASQFLNIVAWSTAKPFSVPISLKTFLLVCATLSVDVRGLTKNRYRKLARLAIEEMVQGAAKNWGANAIIAIDVDYESIEIENGGNMLMVAVSGTAVRVG
jgi:uncharacterized protein YbjQ (UPF0145 family)